ncbi:hypothetical protein [Aliidiomarina maris]|uniref:Secreted protein n=1 Tax=Aliidiomarina maris TaxID=531312 RepID=A0A327X062_9GAMM|nr:hypothetical protein [Aliidiomarina maris]MCL5051620.1 hypothetical protein [Bacillota bacterium]RAJ99099.1 hypothetical protein B0I24_10393 [Aliidiomarina maris]
MPQSSGFGRTIKLSAVAAATGLVLSACTSADPDPQDVFFDTLLAHCGNSYAGAVTIGDEALDADWIAADIVIEVKECSDQRIRIPLHVGDDHSRTWIISRTENGLELKHDHRERDGSHDPMTMYGGETFSPGTPYSQSFPADEYSKQLFAELGATASIGNTWWVKFPDQNTLRYRLVRDDREFQVDVDLSQTVETPPAPWGWEDNYQYRD